MKLFLTIYIIGGVIWFFWSKNQGYTTRITDKVIWPITAFRQVKDTGSVAT